MKKPLLIFFFVILVLFNILNAIDKITTYYGMQQGFLEQNLIASHFFNTMGVLPTAILQVFIGLTASLLIYLAVIHLSNKIKHIEKIVIVPTIFLSLIYLEAVINNIRWLI